MKKTHREWRGCLKIKAVIITHHISSTEFSEDGVAFLCWPEPNHRLFRPMPMSCLRGSSTIHVIWVPVVP